MECCKLCYDPQWQTIKLNCPTGKPAFNFQYSDWEGGGEESPLSEDNSPVGEILASSSFVWMWGSVGFFFCSTRGLNERKNSTCTVYPA